MFTRLATLMQLRRSTAFLLERADDRLLDDIGLNRAELEAMYLGINAADARTKALRFPSAPTFRSLPVGVSA